jgi:aryl carrier-like protein
MAEPLTPASIRMDVAELLHVSPDSVSDTENLFDSGLDSIRIMTLLERWRAAGVEVSFVELAERPTLGEWCALLASRLPVDFHG